ncbi:MAG: hypothetical protein PCFJNLEI_03082 [Verrucomicrobiae bacterium]|nr:hypothetical protein [Verrucomicrobiae bacterium]
MKSLLRQILAVIGIAVLTLSTAAQAQVVTGQVYEISLAGSVIGDDDASPVPFKDKVTTAALLNLARGRAPEASVPANEKLALELFFIGDSEPVVLLAVFDTAGQSNLIVIAELMVRGVFEEVKGKGYLALAGGFDSAGWLGESWLAMTGKATINPDSSVQALVSFSGALQGAFEGNDGEGDFSIIITKGKVTLGAKIGAIVVADE